MAYPTVREAVAVFADEHALETAVSDLQSNGFDRAEISFITGIAVAKAGTNDPQAVAEDPKAERLAGVSDTDVRQGRVLGVGMAATIAGFAAAGFTVATGGGALLAAAVAAVAASGAGVLGELVGRAAPNLTDTFLDAELGRGGVLLTVALRDDDAVDRALGVLRRHSQREVIIREVAVHV